MADPALSKSVSFDTGRVSKTDHAVNGMHGASSGTRQAHSIRRVDAIEAARRACVSAREQHVTARRLLSRVDDDKRAEP